MKPHAGALLLATWALGCSAATETETFNLAIPTDGARYVILVAVHDAGDIEVATAEVSADSKVLIPAANWTDLTADLYALRYECHLGIKDGWQQVTSDDDGLALPAEFELSKTRVANLQTEPWVQLETRPDVLNSIRLDLPADTLCKKFNVEFEIIVLSLPGTEHTTVDIAVQLTDGSAFLGTSGGKFFRVTIDGATRLTNLSTTTPHLAGFAADSGEIWLLGKDGRIVRGHPDTGFSEVTVRSRPGGLLFAWMDGTRGSSPVELLVVDDERTFEHYAQGTWTVLDDAIAGSDGVADLGLQNATFGGGVTWISPDEAIALGPQFVDGSLSRTRTNAVVRFTATGTVVDDDFLTNRVPTTIKHIPNLGTFAGGGRGDLFVRSESGWQLVGDSPLSFMVAAISPLDRGLFFGGTRGATAQYHPFAGICSDETYTLNFIKYITVVSDGLLLSRGRNLQDSPLTVTYLRRASPALDCITSR